MSKRKLWKNRIVLTALLTGALFLVSGCGRETLNRQIAESIGTTGKYENNEPVESPQMKAERELREVQQAKEAELQKILDEAERYAQTYDYKNALDVLEQVEEEFLEDDRVTQARIAYQSGSKKMSAYEPDIPHLYCQSLIVDPARAFDGDDMQGSYDTSMLTVSEFEQILEALYANDYILIDIHEIRNEQRDEDGNVTYTRAIPQVPDGKKPFVLSIEDVNYYEYMAGDGFAAKLVLDENGEVKNFYADAQGNIQVGNYDVIPIVDEFVRQHPDFSLRGARGVVSVTGYEGVFGYRVNNVESETYREDCESVKNISARLRETGWDIACHTYAHGMVGQDFGLDDLKTDTDMWMEEIGVLVGETDIYVYPYGDEVAYPGEKLDYLQKNGFSLFCGLWATEDYTEVAGSYVRQTRRNVDGYSLRNHAESFAGFFDAAKVLDPARPNG